MRPGNGDLVAEEQLLNAVGRAGEETGASLDDSSHVFRVEGVDILQGVHGQEDAVFVALLGQGQLHQDAVYGRIVVEVVDRVQELFGRGGGAQFVQFAADAAFFAGLALVAYVDLTGRVLAHQDRGQAGDHARLLRELGHLLGSLALDLLCQGLSV